MKQPYPDENFDSLEELKALLSANLKCYAVIGYDADGNLFRLCSIHSSLEGNALTTATRNLGGMLDVKCMGECACDESEAEDE